MKVKREREVAQSCPTLSDPMDYSLPDSSSMGFSRQEHWSGVPLPSPPDLLADNKMYVVLSYCVLICYTAKDHESLISCKN